MPGRRLLTWARRAVPGQPWDRATAALLLALAGLALATFRDYGPTFDEPFQREVGQRLLAWYGSGFQDRWALEPGSVGNFHLYGGFFDGPAELAARALPLDPYDARHLVNAAWSLLGLLGTGLLARRLGGPRAGFLALALLAVTGAWWGHGFSNPKDIPFAAPYPWILLAVLAAADDLPRWRPWPLLRAGLALGAALGVRPAGLSALLPLVAGAFALRAAVLLRATPRGGRGRAVGGAAAACAAVVAVAWLVMIASWPWGQLGPFTRPFEAAAGLAGTTSEMAVHFAGRWYSSLALPAAYLPNWLLLTVPDAWLLAGLVILAAALATQGERPPAPDGLVPGAAAADRLVVWVAALGPLAAALALRPPVYDAQRHFLFLLPALAAALADAAFRALERLPAGPKAAAALALGGAWLLGAADLAALHPYQYVAFNRSLAGGVARGVLAYEGDYWGASLREGTRWLAEDSGLGRDRPLGVSTNAAPLQLEHGLAAAGALDRFRPAPAHQADLLLATTRLFKHRTPGRVLHVVARLGAPLLYVIELPPVAWAGVRRLPLGDATVDLPLPPGWLARPVVDLRDPGASFDLLGAGGAAIELSVATPGAGPVPDAGALREAVRRRVEDATGRAVPDGVLAPLQGPATEGWLARWPEPGGGQRLVGALRCGPLALSFVARGGAAELSAAVAALAGAVPGPPPDRLP